MPMDPPRPKVALFRAPEDTAESAAKLGEMGFEAVPLPVLETRPLAVSPTHSRYDAVLATSAKAFLADLPVDRASPLYAVGERTLRVGEAAGWRAGAPPAPDVTRLAALIRAQFPQGAHVLYLAGRDRKPLLETELSARFNLEVLECYAAEARAAFGPDEIAALGGCRAALHYSRRSAALAAGLAERAGVGEAFRGLVHICISDDAAGPIEALATRARIASTATEMSLFAALREALPRGCFG